MPRERHHRAHRDLHRAHREPRRADHSVMKKVALSRVKEFGPRGISVRIPVRHPVECSGLLKVIRARVTPEQDALRKLEAQGNEPSSVACTDSVDPEAPSAPLTMAERNADTTQWVKEQRSINIALELERNACRYHDQAVSRQLMQRYDALITRREPVGPNGLPLESIESLRRSLRETLEQLKNMPESGNWPSPGESTFSNPRPPIPQVLPERKPSSTVRTVLKRVSGAPYQPVAFPPATVEIALLDLAQGRCWHYSPIEPAEAGTTAPPSN